MVMKTLEDERYVVIKAYKCTVSEIWRDSFVLAYIALRVRRIPTYRVYRLCDIDLIPPAIFFPVTSQSVATECSKTHCSQK